MNIVFSIIRLLWFMLLITFVFIILAFGTSLEVIDYELRTATYEEMIMNSAQVNGYTLADFSEKQIGKLLGGDSSKYYFGGRVRVFVDGTQVSEGHFNALD